MHVANVADWSTGVYSALPVDVIGSLYYVMSYVTADQGPSELAIISTGDNTDIRVDLGHNVELAVVNLGMAMSPIGRTAQLTLNKYQTFQVGFLASAIF